MENKYSLNLTVHYRNAYNKHYNIYVCGLWTYDQV
jgi:hypothetical protein